MVVKKALRIKSKFGLKLNKRQATSQSLEKLSSSG